MAINQTVHKILTSNFHNIMAIVKVILKIIQEESQCFFQVLIVKIKVDNTETKATIDYYKRKNKKR